MDDDLGVVRSWGQGPEVIFVSNPMADPVSWSSPVRSQLLALGYQVTTFEHRPQRLDWQAAVASVKTFIGRRAGPVALVGWSQGAAIAQEAALGASQSVRCAALLATYGRQNELDRVLQDSWQRLAVDGEDLDPLRLALGLLTAFPPERLADDAFVRHMKTVAAEWAGAPAPEARQRAATFISTYQDRLPFLTHMTVPCLVIGFELDIDTCAARAREVARAVPRAEYIELPGLAHAAPVTHPQRVWPPVIDFVKAHHPLV
jgi:pimeloyl-ACP methyl ester carboxylesterase